MNLKEKYQKEIAGKLKEDLKKKNVFEVPRIEKVVINIGVGKFLKDPAAIEEIQNSLAAITGQKVVMVKARTSIAGFKTREGMEIGAKVTLRGKRMWDFLEKLVGVAVPRIRDFRGIKKSAIDQNGNLNLGIKEQVIFPEISPEHVKNIFSFQVNVATSAKNQEEGDKLWRALGFPIES